MCLCFVFEPWSQVEQSGGEGRYSHGYKCALDAPIVQSNHVSQRLLGQKAVETRVSISVQGHIEKWSWHALLSAQSSFSVLLKKENKTQRGWRKCMSFSQRQSGYFINVEDGYKCRGWKPFSSVS